MTERKLRDSQERQVKLQRILVADRLADLNDKFREALAHYPDPDDRGQLIVWQKIAAIVVKDQLEIGDGQTIAALREKLSSRGEQFFDAILADLRREGCRLPVEKMVGPSPSLKLTREVYLYGSN